MNAAAAPDCHESIAEFGASRMFYRVRGAATALPDIVLEAGGMTGARSWVHVEQVLAQQARVFSYDRAYMGESRTRDGRGCGAAAVEARLAQLLDRVPVRKPFLLIGYSLGGLYARYYATRHPEQVVGLVLVDATPIAYRLPPDRVRKAMRGLKTMRWLVRLGLGQLLWRLSGRRADAAELPQLIAELKAPDYIERVSAELQAIPEAQAEMAREDQGLRHPLLTVLAGSPAPGISETELAEVRVMHDALALKAPPPLSRVEVVAGASHGPLVGEARYAQALATHILAFAENFRRAG